MSMVEAQGSCLKQAGVGGRGGEAPSAASPPQASVLLMAYRAALLRGESSISKSLTEFSEISRGSPALDSRCQLAWS